MAVKGVIINPVLGAVVLSKGIVGLAGVNPLGMFCACVAYRQRPPYQTKAEILASLDQACKELKLNLEGKLEFKSLDDALNEI